MGAGCWRFLLPSRCRLSLCDRVIPDSAGVPCATTHIAYYLYLVNKVADAFGAMSKLSDFDRKLLYVKLTPIYYGRIAKVSLESGVVIRCPMRRKARFLKCN